MDLRFAKSLDEVSKHTYYSSDRTGRKMVRMLFTPPPDMRNKMDVKLLFLFYVYHIQNEKLQGLQGSNIAIIRN